MEFRNIAIIAHVDHGKTTLVDAMLRQCNVFAAHEHVMERVLDSMDLERERGITIASKNTAVLYGGVKINILDTPGHSDFGGEVERVLSMVEGALLLVDASEGPLPQTRFVLRKALENHLAVIVCINKIDRPDARVAEVLNEIYDLFIELDAQDDTLDFPVLYAVAREGIAGWSPDEKMTDLRPLFDALIANIPAPKDDDTMPRLLVTNLDRDNYVGRLALGRVRGGSLRKGETVTWFGENETRSVRLQLIYSWQGLKRHEIEEGLPGDVVAVAGVEGITVGDTLAGGENPQPLPRVKVDEPTIGMMFTINTSPFAGQEGRFVTSRQIRERLEREMIANVSLRLEDTEDNECFMVWGRGELQLAILVEQMRREGYELTLSRPEVVRKEIDGKATEPWERVHLDVPDEAVGAMTQALAARCGQMLDMSSSNGRTRFVYRAPSRALIGFRGEMLTETRGEGILNTLFDGWDADVGFLRARTNGAIVADRPGRTTAYALFHLQPRGTLFVNPGIEVYEGMVVGEHCRENDLNVNAVRGKQLTNFRASGADEKTVVSTPVTHTLESAIEWIDDDEYVEVTPTAVRIRKKVLASNQRSIRRREDAPL